MPATATDTVRALAAATAARPDDLTAKLVYADALDEAGDPDRAALVRALWRVCRGETVVPHAAPLETLCAVASTYHAERSRIDVLSPFERALLPWFHAAGLAVGLATGPCDRSAVAAAVDEAYVAGGLTPPAVKVWLAGPLHGAVAAHLLSATTSGAQVWAQVRDQVWAQVWAQVGAQVWRACYGQHDAVWLTFYAAFSALGLRGCDRLDGLRGLLAGGWWWPFRGAVVLTERPTRLEMNTAGRLAYVEYADGLVVDKRG